MAKNDMGTEGKAKKPFPKGLVILLVITVIDWFIPDPIVLVDELVLTIADIVAVIIFSKAAKKADEIAAKNGVDLHASEMVDMVAKATHGMDSRTAEAIAYGEHEAVGDLTKNVVLDAATKGISRGARSAGKDYKDLDKMTRF